MTHYSEANPMMGTVANEVEGAGGGKTYPGAALPFGMIQLSPDTITGGDNGAGYSYGHPTIEGFSWVHLSGIGWYGEFGNLQTMPISGSRRYYSKTNEYVRKPIGDAGWESRFDHETEIAQPGYYAVELTDCRVRAEAVAARHAGALRFTFHDGGENHVAVDFYRRIGGHSDAQSVRVVDAQTLEGRVLCTPAGGGWGHGAGNARYEIHFVMQFSRPMDSWAFWNEGEILESAETMDGTSLGLCADFQTHAEEAVEVHAALSFVDLQGARNNFAVEDAPFHELRRRAQAEWTNALNLIDVEGGEARDREVFYSSLYHVLLDPRDFSDCDGRYRIAMGAPQRAADFTFRTIFSGWDVFRSAFPLFSIVRPDVVRDELRSLMEISEKNDGSPFPRWEIVGIESGCMVGDPGANILCDAFVKGLCGFDAERAYQICRRWWLGDRADQGELRDFNRLGYFPDDVSRTMEYSFTAWCLYRLALALGHAEDAQIFLERSTGYRKLYNPENGWMNRRDEEGRFLPFSSKYDERGCVESNVYQQIWFVPHDVDGLRALMGKERFVRELDAFFADANLSAFWNDNYNHSNEPVHTVAHLFDCIGQPEKTQYWVRRIQKEAYRPGPYGYCGNEDVGQMSAWFVLTAMGLHQTALASNRFELNTPLFNRIALRLDPRQHSCRVSRTLEIRTDCDVQENPYLRGVDVNGAVIHRPWLTWEELSNGGVIRFLLSPVPTEFGH